MPKPDAAAVLAEKMVQALHEQRERNPNAPPITVAQLLAQAEPQAGPELAVKALGKKPFATALLVASKKDPDSPIALADDASRFAASAAVLGFVLERLCTADKPLHALDKVAAKLEKPLREPFLAAVREQAAANNLPPTVGTVTIKGKIHLFLHKYPPPLPPAADLAVKLVDHLRARKAEGGAAYPVRFKELVQLTGETFKPAQLRQALLQDTFSRQVLRSVPNETDAPLALAGDTDLLAGSRVLLEYLLEGTTTRAKPLASVPRLKSYLAAELQLPFEAAIARRVAERTLPARVGVLAGQTGVELYLTDQVSPAWLLAHKMLGVLDGWLKAAQAGLRLTQRRLVELADPAAAPEIVRKALADKVLKKRVIVAVAGAPDSPIVSADQRDQLAEDPALLEFALATARTADSQAVPLKDVKKKLDKTLQYTFEQAVVRRMETATLPATVGCLRIKKSPHLFLLQDLNIVPQRTEPASPPPPPHGPVVAPQDFARLFDEAFAQLDRQRGSPNLVNLLLLRQALSVERSLFDAELNRLRRAGRYSLSAAEGRQGITPEERAAGMVEDGTLLLFVSRKRG
jgi:hypothetical protein